MTGEEKEAALQQIDADYSNDVLELRNLLATAKSLLEQANEEKRAARKKSKKVPQ